MEGKPKQIFINNIKYDVIQRSSERDDPKSIDFGVKNMELELVNGKRFQ